MAFLKVVKGAVPGQILELQGERTVLGRHPNCHVVLDDAAVSRHHAQILESHQHFYLEDLRSRNHTYLNGTRVEGRTELNDADEVKVCGVLFRFHTDLPPADSGSGSVVAVGGTRVDGQSPPVRKEAVRETRAAHEGASVLDQSENGKTGISADQVSDMAPTPAVQKKSSIITTLDVKSSDKLRLGVQPEAKLRAVLHLSSVLSRVLRVEDVLTELLDALFQVFPQAQFGVALLKDLDSGELEVHATKAALPTTEQANLWSRTIVRQAMETGKAILSADAASDQIFSTSQSVTKMRISSMMCVPLLSKDREAVGAVQIVTQTTKLRFSNDDLELLVSMGAQAELAVQNARLHEELLQQRDIARDLEVATQIQLGFLPNKRPKLAGYDFYDYYEAAQSVGGDYFDYVPLPNNRVAVAVADVAGKGVAAALLMARLYSAARFHLLMAESPAAAMYGLNREIVSSGLGFRFITCVIAVLDPQQDELTVANAGHMLPLIRRGDSTVEGVGKDYSGMPLGVLPDQQFREFTVPLARHDTVVLYTDGVTEAMNPNQDLYGKLLNRYLTKGPADVEELVKGIVQDVERFCEGRPQSDDMCLVCFRRNG